MKSPLLVSILCCTLYAPSVVLSDSRIQLVDSKTTIISGSQKSSDEYKKLTKEQFSKVLTQEHISASIPHNRDVGVLSLRVFSPIKTKIFLKWDNEDSIYIRRSEEIKFRRAGDYQSIHFNVIKPVNGFVYLMTEDNQVIRKVQYSIKKQRKFSQSIRFSITESENGFSDDENQSSSINYSIRQRSSSGTGTWSGNIGISENSANSKSTSASISYSW